MAKIGLIITLGTRDIQIKDKSIIEQLKNDAPHTLDDKGNLLPRPFGEFLKNSTNFDTYKNSLTYPIIDKAIDLIKLLIPKAEFKGVTLVATDQPSSVGEFFYKKDTIHYADLLKGKKLTKHGAINIQKVSGTVNILDAMFKEFGRMINNKNFNHFDDCDAIFICNQSGIDAINTGLMLNAILKFGSKLKTINVDEKTKTAIEVNTTHLFLKLFQKKEAIQLIRRYDYLALQDLDLIPKNIRDFGLYAFNRLNFDFEQAQRIIQPADIPTSEKLRWLADVRIYNDNEDTNNAGKVKELYYNACIKFKQGAYIDFLLRSFRMVEEKAKILVQEKIGFRLEESKLEEQVKLFESNLTIYLDSFTLPNGEKLRYLGEKNVNIAILLAILSYYFPESNSEMRCLKGLQALSLLRNKSIGAHGFKPVSIGIIENELKKFAFESCDLFLDELRLVLNAGTNPFDEINEWLLKELDNITY